MNTELHESHGYPFMQDTIAILEARLESARTELDYDVLLVQILRERGFRAKDVKEIQETAEFVTEATKGHLRKDNVTPTSVHYKRVAIIVAAVGGDVFNVKHALLHDLIEDTKEFRDRGIQRKKITERTLRHLFGEEIAEAVGSVTKVKTRALQRLAGEKSANQFVDRNLLLQTHYKLFESLKDPRVIITKLADRLDYFLTLVPEIPKANIRRKALETLKLYVPLADMLRMHGLREELTYQSLRVLMPKKVRILHELNDTVYSPMARQLMEAEIRSAVVAFDPMIVPMVVATVPSWYRVYNDYGSFLDGVTRTTENPSTIYLSLPTEPAGQTRGERLLWLGTIRPLFDHLANIVGFSRDSWEIFASASMDGDRVELAGHIGNRPVAVVLGSSERLARDLMPITDHSSDQSGAKRDFQKLRENFDQLVEIWPPNKFGQNEHLGMIVGEIMDHLQRPLVRVWGNDGNAFILPKGATLFDAACLFGKRVAKNAGRIEVKYGSATFHHVHLGERLRDGQHIFVSLEEGRNNLTPDALPLAHTRLAKATLRKELLRHVRKEKTLPAGERAITRQLIHRGIDIFRKLYEEQAHRVSIVPRKLDAEEIAVLFTHPAIRPIVRDTTFPTFEAFMVALSLDQLSSKKRQSLLTKLVRKILRHTLVS